MNQLARSVDVAPAQEREERGLRKGKGGEERGRGKEGRGRREQIQ